MVKIAERATDLAARATGDADRLPYARTLMDLEGCHCNGCPLKLDELLAADDYEFLHDVGGIADHIDRRTGQLGGCFTPRYAV